MSLMSTFIKQTMKKVNREQQATTTERFTSELLETMNVTQIQIIVNEIYDFRQVLNEILMIGLVERDELMSKRDGLLQRIDKSDVPLAS